jgi:hypothetical protein
MIHISNYKAEEIKIVLGDLRRMAWNIPGTRASNMRRRAKLIIDYITKKEEEQNGTKSTTKDRPSDF